MPLSAGTRLGPYEVGTALGAGGMGEVYRATDTNLKRAVAVKVLHDALASDAERVARFQREAEVLASLNHPNIASIYGLERVDGRTALVLELVEGPTLADRIAVGPIPVDEAVPIAKQIAEALEAAHDQGVVHRDLKPANIKIRPNGIVKVLDFGLAKLTESPAQVGTSGLSQPPTITSPAIMTGAGVFLGTAAYMSPEQARGRPVDKRTDIWAFGCVLFEMLSGRRAFEGDGVTDTLARILEREPDWAALPSTTPETVRKLLRRCLVKEPSRRLRDIGDVRLELDDAAASGAPTTVATPRGRRGHRLVLSCVALTAGLAVVAVWLLVPQAPESVADTGMRSGATPLTRFTFDPGLQTDPALKADGSFVVYSSNKEGNFNLYTQPVGGGNAVRVTDDPAHDWQPDLSIEDQIVFRSERDGGGLYVVPQTGGHEQRIASFGHKPQWSPDGKQVLFTNWNGNSLHAVRLSGAPTETILPVGLTAAYGAYGWFRDVSHISTLATDWGPPFTPHLRIVDLKTSAADEWTVAPAVLTGFRELRIQVQLPRTPLAWSADARAVYFAGLTQGVSSIWKLDVDPDARRVAGGPHRVAQMAEATTGVSIARATGAIAFAAAERIPRIWWYPLDASGRRLAGAPKPLTAAQTAANIPSVTPDGRLLVFSVSQPGGQGGTQLRTKTLDDGVERILRESDTTRGESRTFLHPSPDGRRVVFRYVPPDRKGDGLDSERETDLRVIDLVTMEESRLTGTAAGAVRSTGWSADGRFVVVAVDRRRLGERAQGRAIGLLPLAAAPNAESQMKIATQYVADLLHQPTLSPNGRWMAFVVGGSFRIAVVGSADGQWSTPQDERAWRYIDEDVSPKDKPRWSHDGRLLYFTSARGGLLNVWAVDFDPVSGAFGASRQVTDFDGPGEQIPSVMPQLEIGVAPRGLLLPTIRPAGGIWLLHPPR